MTTGNKGIPMIGSSIFRFLPKGFTKKGVKIEGIEIKDPHILENKAQS